MTATIRGPLLFESGQINFAKKYNKFLGVIRSTRHSKNAARNSFLPLRREYARIERENKLDGSRRACSITH